MKKCRKCGTVNGDSVMSCYNCGDGMMFDYDYTEVVPQNASWFADKIYEGKVNLPVANCSIVLKKDEKPQIVIPNVTLKEPRSVRTSTGMYGGPSFRVAKGVSFKVGGAESRSESHEEIRDVDIGTLTITNKRLVFTGQKKTINYNLNKIISVQHYSEGVGIQRENKQKTEYFLGIDRRIITFKKDGELQRSPFFGILLHHLLLRLIENYE